MIEARAEPPTAADAALRGAAAKSRRRRGLKWKIGAFLLLAATPLAFKLPFGRSSSGTEGQPPEMLTVGVVKVLREDLSRQMAIDAEFRPYFDIDLRAKVAGFLQSIEVDVGDKVKEGQVLAVLEIPELKEEIDRSRAVEKRSEEEVRRAKAAHQEMHLAYARLASAAKERPNLVAQQDLDTAAARDETDEAAVSSADEQVRVAKAEIDKLEAERQFSKITAPFSGVITKRYADQGDFIQGGITPSTQAKPLVRLAQIERLRLVVPVSVTYASRIRIGDPVEIRVESLGRKFAGTISRFARELDTATRRMHTEVDVPNLDSTLYPGMYASVVLSLDLRRQVLAVPVEAVSRGNTPTCYVVNGKDEIEERSLQLGLETPYRLEVISGLMENEQVMIGGRSQVKPGQKVQPKLIQMTAKD